MSGSNLKEPVGVPFLWVDIPGGKYLTGVDGNGEEYMPVYSDLSKNETQLLKEKTEIR